MEKDTQRFWYVLNLVTPFVQKCSLHLRCLPPADRPRWLENSLAAIKRAVQGSTGFACGVFPKGLKGLHKQMPRIYLYTDTRTPPSNNSDKYRFRLGFLILKMQPSWWWLVLGGGGIEPTSQIANRTVMKKIIRNQIFNHGPPIQKNHWTNSVQTRITPPPNQTCWSPNDDSEVPRNCMHPKKWTQLLKRIPGIQMLMYFSATCLQFFRTWLDWKA